MLDALQAYRDTAAGSSTWAATASTGRSRSTRRATASSRSAAAKAASAPGRPSPASTTTSSTREYGGLWRRNARPPQKLVGVGLHRAGQLRRLALPHQPGRAATPRSAGSSTASRPTPSAAKASPGTARPASNWTASTSAWARHRAPSWWPLREPSARGAMGAGARRAADAHHHHSRPDAQAADPRRHDLVRLPGGGEVFSVGSITFCGSLPVNGFDNDISRILHNVVTRFSR
jgi:N,N-dimethylformamidase